MGPLLIHNSTGAWVAPVSQTIKRRHMAHWPDIIYVDAGKQFEH